MPPGPDHRTNGAYEDLDDDDELLLVVEGKDAASHDAAPVAEAQAERLARPPREGLWRKLLACFSMARNMPKLLSMAPQKGAVPSLHGIRVLSMCWVVLGHVFLMALQVMPGKFPVQALRSVGVSLPPLPCMTHPWTTHPLRLPAVTLTPPFPRGGVPLFTFHT